MYTKGQLIRVSDIDRMITREDFNLEESYVSRQNSSHVMQRLNSNKVAPELPKAEEELKLPPIHQNRPCISTIIFPAFDDKILCV